MVKIASTIVLFATCVLTWALPSEADVRQRLVELALSLQGTPYVYGAESARGFDCSGFVHYLYSNAAFLDVPRTSRSQSARGEVVDLADAQPGDVLVYGSPAGVPTHVAIYLGNGTLVHAASRGPHRGIVIANLTDRYFESHFLGVRSFFSSAGAPAPEDQEGAPVVLRCQLSAPIVSKTETKPVFLGSPVVVSLANPGEPAQVTVTVELEAEEPQAPLVQQVVDLDAHAVVNMEAFVPPEPGSYRLSVVGDNLAVDSRWRVVQRWGS